ncbi:MAG: hypothetical protein IPN26_12100 [Bacteroidetes bacterium]|nr:hypothetical protein [Bacteroidota bacterium]
MKMPPKKTRVVGVPPPTTKIFLFASATQGARLVGVPPTTTKTLQSLKQSKTLFHFHSPATLYQKTFPEAISLIVTAFIQASSIQKKLALLLQFYLQPQTKVHKNRF